MRCASILRAPRPALAGFTEQDGGSSSGSAPCRSARACGVPLLCLIDHKTGVHDARHRARDIARGRRAAPWHPVSPRYRIQAIERAVGILNAFTVDDPELGVTELAEKVGLHKSTVHRFMVNLDAAGLVERNPRNGRYRLGPPHLRARRPGDAADEPLGRGAAVPRGSRARHRRDRPSGRARRGRGDLHRARRGAPGAARPLGHRPGLSGARDQPRQGPAGRPAARARRRDHRREGPRLLHTQHHHRPRPASRPSSSGSANAAMRSTTRSTTRACAASAPASATTAGTSSRLSGSGGR